MINRQLLVLIQLSLIAFMGCSRSATNVRVETDKMNVTPSEKAFLEHVNQGNTIAVDSLLTAGIKPNVKNHNGDTALMLATQNDNITLVQSLLDKGADVNAKNNQGITPWMLSVFKGFTEIAKILLKHGADINAKNEFGNTALLVAADQKHTALFKFLLGKGCKH